MTEHTHEITPSTVENTSTLNVMNWLRQKKAAASIVFGAAALSLAGCTSAEAVHTPEHTATATHKAETKKPAPSYQEAPTEAQLSALYMPTSATDEQLAQNFIKVSNFMWAGPSESAAQRDALVATKYYTKITETGLDGEAAHKKMTDEWVVPIVNDANLFVTGVNTPNYGQWLNIAESNFASSADDKRPLELVDYKSFQSISDSPQQRTVNVAFNYNIDTSRNLSGNGAQNGQEGMWQITYVPSADGAHWAVAKMADVSYMLQK